MGNCFGSFWQYYMLNFWPRSISRLMSYWPLFSEQKGIVANSACAILVQLLDVLSQGNQNRRQVSDLVIVNLCR